MKSQSDDSEHGYLIGANGKPVYAPHGFCVGGAEHSCLNPATHYIRVAFGHGHAGSQTEQRFYRFCPAHAQRFEQDCGGKCQPYIESTLIRDLLAGFKPIGHDEVSEAVSASIQEAQP